MVGLRLEPDLDRVKRVLDVLADDASELVPSVRTMRSTMHEGHTEP